MRGLVDTVWFILCPVISFQVIFLFFNHVQAFNYQYLLLFPLKKQIILLYCCCVSVICCITTPSIRRFECLPHLICSCPTFHFLFGWNCSADECFSVRCVYIYPSRGIFICGQLGKLCQDSKRMFFSSKKTVEGHQKLSNLRLFLCGWVAERERERRFKRKLS